MHQIHPRTLKRMKNSKKNAPSSDVLAMVSQITELVNNVDNDSSASSDNDGDGDGGNTKSSKHKQVQISNAAFKIIEEVGAKLSFADQNQKRKEATYSTFHKSETEDQCTVVSMMIEPLVTPIDVLMKRTSILAELANLPVYEVERKQDLEQEQPDVSIGKDFFYYWQGVQFNLLVPPGAHQAGGPQ